MARKKQKQRPVYRARRDNMLTMGAKNLVGVGMIGATASMTNALPTGTAKSIAGIVPGLQATALVGENVKYMKPIGGRSRRMRRRRK